MDGFRDRIQNPVTCVRCLEVRDQIDVDRLLWCLPCRESARARAGRVGWLAGAVLGAGLALWIWLVVQPSDLVIGGWVATVVAALWIGGKVAREIAFGVMRFRNAGAVEAFPPALGQGEDAGS